MSSDYSTEDLMCDIDMLNDAAEALLRMHTYARKRHLIDDCDLDYLYKTQIRVDNVISMFDRYFDGEDACND